MSTSSASRSPAQARKLSSLQSSNPAPFLRGTIFPFTPRIIDRRKVLNPVTDGEFGTITRLVIPRGDQAKLGDAKRIDILQGEDDPPVELYQQLSLTVTGCSTENWRQCGIARILEVAAEPVPFKPEFCTRVEGIPAADCRGLEKKFGPASRKSSQQAFRLKSCIANCQLALRLTRSKKTRQSFMRSLKRLSMMALRLCLQPGIRSQNRSHSSSAALPKSGTPKTTLQKLKG
jgi:hypothetical protein